MVGAIVVVAVLALPGPGTSTQSTLTTLTTSSSLISTTYTKSTSTCSLWALPSGFNQTITLKNSTLLYSTQSPPISLQANQSLYLGFNLTNVAQISGEVKTASPITVEIIQNTNGSIFPINSGDRTVFSKTNTTDASFFLPSPISGNIVAGSYAILFQNKGSAQANITAAQSITVVYPNCP